MPPVFGAVSAARHTGRAVWMLGGRARRRQFRDWQKEEALMVARAASRIAWLFGSDAIPLPFIVAWFGEKYVHETIENAAGAVYDWFHREHTDEAAGV